MCEREYKLVLLSVISLRVIVETYWPSWVDTNQRLLDYKGFLGNSPKQGSLGRKERKSRDTDTSYEEKESSEYYNIKSSIPGFWRRTQSQH